jgi:hypothetical protein
MEEGGVPRHLLLEHCLCRVYAATVLTPLNVPSSPTLNERICARAVSEMYRTLSTGEKQMPLGWSKSPATTLSSPVALSMR